MPTFGSSNIITGYCIDMDSPSQQWEFRVTDLSSWSKELIAFQVGRDTIRLIERGRARRARRADAHSSTAFRRGLPVRSQFLKGWWTAPIPAQSFKAITHPIVSGWRTFQKAQLSYFSKSVDTPRLR